MNIISHNEMSEGLFGQIILYIFEILPILENNKINPKRERSCTSSVNWKISTLSYGDIFPNILECNSKYNNNNIFQFYDINLRGGFAKYNAYVLGDDFIKLNKLFFKYFTIPYKLIEIANNFNLKNFTGLHFRGSDKTTDTCMNTPITKLDFYIIIDEYIKTNKIKNIFLATDENDILDYFKYKYPNIIFKSSRSFKGNLFWKNNSNNELNAKSAMIDMLCLSQCKEVLKVSSALSSFAKIINPNLKIFRLNALKMFNDIPYFPDAYIPLFKKKSDYSDECNRIIDKIQSNDWSKKYYDKFNNFYYKVR